MSSIEIAARFAAYTWFRNQPHNRKRSADDALLYADRNHRRYLDVALANRGVGRLLAHVIATREHSCRADANPWNGQRWNSSELCGSK
jgi:hypothetical protein